ncbi:MAG: WXG100 family type VII secretion target [Lachnospiraceae bacterium]|nr:WXG100 family type VII secretion target [Lachnospiraceae bacterium]
MAEIHLKVAPDKLHSKADEISRQINQIQADWNNLSEIIKKTKSYWKGDASDLHQKYRDECEKEMLEILKRLKEHPTDLLKMAGIYEEAEDKAIQLAQSLPDEVIL